MKHKFLARFSCLLLTFAVGVGVAACSSGDEGAKRPEEFTDYVTLQILPDSTKLVHAPSGVVDSSYRYGPSMMFEGDTLYMWTSSPGRFKTQWDWIRFRSSTDKGTTWSDETIALKPTPGTDDAWSVCDPGAIKLGEYYYIGYTSCYNTFGHANNVFVARSQNPYGPFDEKWAGNGWSTTEAQPVIYYDHPSTEDPSKDAFGAGEPTFTVVDGTLYMYYSWGVGQNGADESYIKVATAPADDPDWPAKLQDRGVAFKHGEAEDSGDVVYVEALERFVYVNIGRRYMDNCRIVIRQSADGIHWDENVSYARTGLAQYAHNGGISKDVNGHIKKGDNVYFAYAHAQNLNATEVNWATRICKVSLSLSDEPQDDMGRPIKMTIPAGTLGSDAPQAVYVSDPNVRIYMGAPTHQLRMKLLNNKMSTRVLSEEEIKDIEFYGYDSEIIDISSTGLITAKKTGTTHVYTKYKNDDRLSDHFVVYVGEGEFTEPIASGVSIGRLEYLTDSDLDTEFTTNKGDNLYFGLETADGSNAPLKGIHLYGQVEGNYFPDKYEVQVRTAGGDWTTVPDTEWDYLLLTKESSTTALTPVTIVFKEVKQVCGVRILGERTVQGEAIGVASMEAFASEDEIKIVSARPMKTEYTLDSGDTTGLFKSAQLKLYVAYNYEFWYEVFNADHGVTYASDNTSVVMVDNKGTITAVAAGETTVRMSWRGTEYSVKVTVK
mgnify:CR=1 FL=1